MITNGIYTISKGTLIDNIGCAMYAKGGGDEYQQSVQEDLRWRDSKKMPPRKTQEEMEL